MHFKRFKILYPSAETLPSLFLVVLIHGGGPKDERLLLFVHGPGWSQHFGYDALGVPGILHIDEPGAI